MKKKAKNTISKNIISQFLKCRQCIYFPNISVSAQDYIVDKYGVKHRDIHYVCQYDLHEINIKDQQCPRSTIL